MGSLYRSELMSLCQLFLHSEMAYDEVAKLGELGVVHFIDLNSEISSFQRRFVNDLKRCDLMAQKLQFIEEQILADFIPIPRLNGFVPAPLPNEMNILEAEIEKIEEQLIENNMNMKNLMDNYAQLNECMQCINKVQHLLTDEQQQTKQSVFGVDQENLASGIGAIRRKLTNAIIRRKDSLISGRRSSIFSGEKLDISFVAGIVERRHSVALERLLWRTCGLNVFVRIVTIDFSEDPLLNDVSPKDVFLIFFSGTILGLRVRKMCQCYQMKVYDSKDMINDRVLQVTNLFRRVTEIKSVIEETRKYRNTLLQATAYKVHEWDIKLQKMSAVFETMNMCNVDITQRYLIAECWIPTADIICVRNSLNKTSTEKNSSPVSSFLCEIETNKIPPTYFRINKFTKVFQNIVNSYGVATYREINPAPWTIITFPFLFAVMFGDAGHGLIMFFIALAFILLENKIKTDDEIMGTFYLGRFIILLMGLFSIYTGFIYNDFYSRSMNLFESSWHNPYNLTRNEKTARIYLTLSPQYAYDRDKGPYVFGLDPVWNLAENRLTFTNSMKMKISIIFGITQMTFGVILSLMNFFTTPGDIFGFFYPGSHCAPSLLIGLINMCMLKPRKQGFWNHSSSTELEYCYLQEWYPNQGIVEKGLLILALLCIPAMLLVKPIYLKFKFRKIGNEEVGNIDNDEVKKFDFMNVLMHQGIHTIEFALGCISHTASYLRLWALSLAHAQLSEVLWSMVLSMAFSFNAWSSGPVLYLISWFYGVLTFAILILMEGLSTFLHTLRLHWVEFQSKFYGGHGYLFKPFAFTQMKSFKHVNKKDEM
ncbi:unnamed protein product [Acanthocheilonema viteae]|uniref:V-type proton ATPase subunit a n=1 Tax=Acanthocheilonema viteae TaxID=6277 RepID=A0A498RWY8_ACAVI|nr:unnamed protein product [Acanthocheilonema viteae]